MMPLSSTKTAYVAYATSGLWGNIGVLLVLILLSGGIILFAKGLLAKAFRRAHS